MKIIQIARFIDEPPHFLLWQIDELAPPLLGLMAGIIADNVLLFLIFGFVCNFLYRRFRDNHPRGYLIHLAYYYLGLNLRGRCFPNSFIRDFF